MFIEPRRSQPEFDKTRVFKGNAHAVRVVSSSYGALPISRRNGRSPGGLGLQAFGLSAGTRLTEKPAVSSATCVADRSGSTSPAVSGPTV